MDHDEYLLRQRIIEQCVWMNDSGLNQGTSGNISARYEDRMLISPSATPYAALKPHMIASMPINGDHGSWDGPLKPSSEWRIHLDIMEADPTVGAIVHAHPTYSTALAILKRDLPACHYMMAAFGGTTVRCADYATFGTEQLSKNALKAMQGRSACLLANHGIIATGETLEKAMWRANELETICRQYTYASMLGAPVILSDDQIDDTMRGFSTYGVQDDHKKL